MTRKDKAEGDKKSTIQALCELAQAMSEGHGLAGKVSNAATALRDAIVEEHGIMADDHPATTDKGGA